MPLLPPAALSDAMADSLGAASLAGAALDGAATDGADDVAVPLEQAETIRSRAAATASERVRDIWLSSCFRVRSQSEGHATVRPWRKDGFRGAGMIDPRVDATLVRRLLRHEAEVHAIPGRELRDLGDDPRRSGRGRAVLEPRRGHPMAGRPDRLRSALC